MKIGTVRVKSTPREMEVWDIDKDLAAELLKNPVELQRRVSNAYVSKYSRDMAAGKWDRNSHQPILVVWLDGRAYTADGIHRMKGVIKAGVTVKMPVVQRHVDSKDELHAIYRTIDAGRARNDAARIQEYFGIPLDKMYASTVKRMYVGAQESGPDNKAYTSSTEFLGLLATHFEVLDFVIRCMPEKKRVVGVRTAPVMGAICNAAYTLADKNIIKEICDVLINNSSPIKVYNHDILQRLRDELITGKTRGRESHKKNGVVNHNDIFLNVQLAIQATLAGHRKYNFRYVKEGIYPLPVHVQSFQEKVLSGDIILTELKPQGLISW